MKSVGNHSVHFKPFKAVKQSVKTTQSINMKFFVAAIISAAIAGTMGQMNAAEYNLQAAYGAAPSYSAPAPSYSAPAPAYSPPSYAPAPAYQPAPQPGPAKSYSYQSPAPQVPCPQNLLLSCAPSVQPVPCVAPPPSYSKPSYSAPAAPSYAPSRPSY